MIFSFDYTDRIPLLLIVQRKRPNCTTKPNFPFPWYALYRPCRSSLTANERENLNQVNFPLFARFE